ncbi:MAG: hypothetical protein GY820_09925, partial [Gammaproteobacteria bacterium]|nr:hypothetical protein [Gammaproteobacteria bacterium]
NDKGANDRGANDKGANDKGANDKGANDKGANDKGANCKGEVPNDFFTDVRWCRLVVDIIVWWQAFLSYFQRSRYFM